MSSSAAALTKQASNSGLIVKYEGEGSQRGNTQFCMNVMVGFCWKNNLLHYYNQS